MNHTPIPDETGKCICSDCLKARREAIRQEFEKWVNSLTPEELEAHIKSGLLRRKLPPLPEKKELSKNQKRKRRQELLGKKKK